MPPSLFILICVAAGLLGILALFVSLKMDVEARSRRERVRVAEILARLDDAESRLSIPQSLYVAEMPRSSFNINQRVQVMRLFRQGQNVNQIASSLEMPRREVELMLRVQEMASSGTNFETE
jgi:hypothetical protein